ncbi:ABC transporter ATP-binding protein [Wolbachia endosymbiont of Pentidionis agamae]|uniref:ABC transporter ATP-binding protein n=1 Tax=Wolbachia endosymbiont of Pentidionis agamae TaxID=3110435 RepID=UPI002FD5F7EC
MNPAISIQNLSLSFFEKKILDKVSFDVLKGESLVILGESGSGKSVLLKIIIGLLKADSGKIVISDTNNFGVAFQNSALFDCMTVWENISFNYKKRFNINKEKAKLLAIERLYSVGLSESIAEMMPIELSGGMRKRVALARAIAHDPETIILDEPTSGLDPIISDVINEIIINLHGLATIITVTHDIYSAFRIADRMVMLREGKIIFLGNKEEIQNTHDDYIKKFIHI